MRIVELMVKQVKGEYAVKDSGLKPLYKQVSDLARQFDKRTIQHVPREQNTEADRLSNVALEK